MVARGRVNRRQFLKGALAGVACAAINRNVLLGVSTRPASTASRPNILLIVSDEHNPKVAGCYGNATAKTPHLDELAAGGVTFENAYTNSPLCVPCRQSMTMGKYCSRIGVWSNNCYVPDDKTPSIAHSMNAAGYQSYLCGKMHYDATTRYGFADVGGNMNNGFMSGHGSRRPADLLPAGKLSNRFEEFRTGETSSVIAHDSSVTTGAVEFLRKYKRSDKPFFFLAGYIAPHFPLIVPERYYAPFKGKIPMPVIPPGHLNNLPLNYKHLRSGFGMTSVPEDIVRRGRELYYGLTYWVDDQIGRTLAALKQSPAADNTVVIYTTDHGENMGEHGLWWKNCMYENAARVPLIVNWPQRWKGGQRRAGACSLVDVMQTVADMGGARCGEDWNGTSLCRWMDDASASWKDLAVSEYYAHNIASGYAMLRSGQYKYVYHTAPDEKHAPQRELYDLKADPDEFTNLATQPEQKVRVEQLHAALVKELGEDPEKTEHRCRADYAKGYGRSGGGGGGKKGRKNAGGDGGAEQ